MKKITLVLLSLTLTIGILEAIALVGFVDYRILLGTVRQEPWHNPLNRLDPQLLHLHRPQQRATGTQLGGDITHYYDIAEYFEYPYDVAYDRIGFRNDTDIDAADVAVIGDSFVEAVLASSDKIVTSQLSRLLDQVVVNLGQIWYGPQQEQIVFERYALPLMPKVVVWVFFGGNDLHDYRRYEQVRASWEEHSAYFHSFSERSLTKNVARRLLLPFRARNNKPPAHYGDCRYGADNRKLYFFYPEVAMNEQDQRAFEGALDILRRVQSQAAQHEIIFLVAYAPTKYQVYKNYCDFPPGSEVAKWRESKLSHILAKALAENIPATGFIDLTEPLQDAVSRGEQVYMIDDTHWTPEGNLIVAEAITAYLRENR